MKYYPKHPVEVTREFQKMAADVQKLSVEYPIDISTQHKVWFEHLDHFPGICFFIHDFLNFKYILCKSLKNVMGYEDDFLIGKSFGETIELFHPEDAVRIRLIHQKLFDFFYQQPVETRTKFRFDFNYRVRHKNGEYKHLLQQSVFLVLKDGKPLYDFSSCTDITGIQTYHTLFLSIYLLNEEGTYIKIFNYTQSSLSERESQIQNLLDKGKSSKEIAEELQVSIHTIHNHRKNINKKRKHMKNE